MDGRWKKKSQATNITQFYGHEMGSWMVIGHLPSGTRLTLNTRGTEEGSEYGLIWTHLPDNWSSRYCTKERKK